ARGRRVRGLCSQFLAVAVLALVHAVHARASSDSCFDQLSDGYLSQDAKWRQRGSTVERKEVPPEFRGRPLLVQVEEEGVDVSVQVLDARETLVAQSDSPLERSAFQYLFLPTGNAGVTLVATANEPAGTEGFVHLTFLSPDTAADDAGLEDCVAAL